MLYSYDTHAEAIMTKVSHRPHGRVSADIRPSLDDAARLHTSLGGDRLAECPRCGNRNKPPHDSGGVAVFVCASCGFKMVVDRAWDRSFLD